MRNQIVNYIRHALEGRIDVAPGRVTFVQSCIVTVLAVVLSVVLFVTVGVHYHSVWYHLFASLFIASLLAPVFLYPTHKTADQLRQAKAIIEGQAKTDHLTGLPNMFALMTRLEELFRGIRPGEGFALHFMDLDRFKQVNDSLGHDAGNQLLIAAAARLREWTGPHGFVARYGGDEFVVIQYDVSDKWQVSRFAMDLRSVFTESFHVQGQDVSVGATVGTALAPTHCTELRDLLKAADMALYEAKSARLPHSLYEPKLAIRAQRRRRVESALRSAIEQNYVKPHFQSIVRTDNPLHIVGFEALARIRFPNGEVLSPARFIPVAESTGMIIELGEFMLRQACFECARWRDDLFVAVNVSPVQLTGSDFVGTVVLALNESGLPAHRLELEITESVLISNIARIGEALTELRGMGIRIALDDFGSGFCGLHYLRHFAIDKIKVDKTIIDEADTKQIAGNILRSVSQMAREMDLKVTLEGIDTLAKAEFLARENCGDQFQGFLFSRPVPAEIAFDMQQFMSQANEPASVLTFSEFAKRIHEDQTGT